MTTSRKTQSALRAALKNEDAVLAQRLPDTKNAAKPASVKRTTAKRAPATPDVSVTPPSATVIAAEVQMPAESPAKPEKRVRKTFSLGRSDIDRLAALKARGEKHGARYGRSAIMRAALLLLGTQDAAKVSALVEQLPAFKKGKRKKK